MGNEPYDYRKYDQIWKRVAPQENPYPAARAAAPDGKAATAAPAVPAAPAGSTPAYQTLLREELRAVTRSLRQMGIAREDALRLISEFWEETSCENT